MSVKRIRLACKAPLKICLHPVGAKIAGCASFPLPSAAAAALLQVFPSGKMRKVAIDRIFGARPARV